MGKARAREPPEKVTDPGKLSWPKILWISTVILGAVVAAIDSEQPALLEHTFVNPGSLGLHLRAAADGKGPPLVTAVSKPGVPRQLVGLVLLAVAGTPVAEWSIHEELLQHLRAAPRPLTVKFGRTPQVADVATADVTSPEEPAVSISAVQKWAAARNITGLARLSLVTLPGHPPMRSLVASTPACPGSVLLSVPASTILTSELGARWPGTKAVLASAEAGSEAERLLKNPWKQLLIGVMVELGKGDTSLWAPWLATATAAVQHVGSITDEVLTELEPLPNKALSRPANLSAVDRIRLLTAVEQHHAIPLGTMIRAARRAWHSLEQSVVTPHPDHFPGGTFNWDVCWLAWKLITTRAFSIRGKHALVPYADFANHQPAALLSGPRVSYDYDSKSQSFRMVNHRPLIQCYSAISGWWFRTQVKAGQQIEVSYTHATPAGGMLANYGFVAPWHPLMLLELPATVVNQAIEQLLERHKEIRPNWDLIRSKTPRAGFERLQQRLSNGSFTIGLESDGPGPRTRVIALETADTLFRLVQLTRTLAAPYGELMRDGFGKLLGQSRPLGLADEYFAWVLLHDLFVVLQSGASNTDHLENKSATVSRMFLSARRVLLGVFQRTAARMVQCFDSQMVSRMPGSPKWRKALLQQDQEELGAPNDAVSFASHMQAAALAWSQARPSAVPNESLEQLQHRFAKHLLEANGEQQFGYIQPAELKTCQAATGTIDLQGIEVSQDGLKAARALHGYATTQTVHQVLRVGVHPDQGPWTFEEATAANCTTEAHIDPFVFGSGVSLGRASQLMARRV